MLSKIFRGSESFFKLVNWQTYCSYAHEWPGVICQYVGTFNQVLMSARCTLSSPCNVSGIDTIKVKSRQNDVSIHKSFLALFSLSSKGRKKKTVKAAGLCSDRCGEQNLSDAKCNNTVQLQFVSQTSNAISMNGQIMLRDRSKKRLASNMNILLLFLIPLWQFVGKADEE